MLAASLSSSSPPLDVFLCRGRGLDHKASWTLVCCGQGPCRSVLDVACPGELGCKGGVGGWGPGIDSLAQSRNADEPEAGVGGSREDTEDAGALSRVPFSWGRREGLVRDSPVGPLWGQGGW